MKSFVSFFLLAFTCQYAYNQNLVKDPGFENYSKPYRSNGNFRSFRDWHSPSKGSPDLICPQSPDKAYRYKNFCGYSKPFQGNVYVGFVAFCGKDHLHSNFREYMMTRLTSPLEKGEIYCISMYVSLGDKVRYASDGIDICFTEYRVRYNTYGPLPLQPTLTGLGGIVKDTSQWIRICGFFKAKGGEKHLIIGNFRDDRHTSNERVQKKMYTYEGKKYDDSYYYIDNVELYKISDTAQCQCIQEKQDTIAEIKETNDSNYYKQAREHSITLKNIFFETAKAELLPESYAELDKLAAYLQANSETKIEISGHTDNVGTAQYNQELSEARAKTVAEYLTKQGINAQRITVYGYGNTQPIDDNNTEEGRAKNRRVEFRIIAF